MRAYLHWLCVGLMWVSSAMAAEKSLFWQMQSPTGTTSYLFGTMHTDDNRVTNFPPAVVDALKSSDTFMMEVTENNDPSLFLLPQGNLAQHLTNDEFEKIRDLTDFHVMHIGAAMQMKPWLLAVVFDLPKPQTPFAQDNLLKTKAEEMNKFVVGLESPTEHFGVMDSFSLDEQLLMLRAVLKRTQAEKEKDFNRLLTAYLSGDADKVANLDDKITGGMLPNTLWQRMRIKLLDERNGVMATRSIEKANQGSVFIAVGAAHLAGKTGLIEAFKQAGFKLTPMKPAR